MKTHRDGEPVVVCDGCYQVINMRTEGRTNFHTLSLAPAGQVHACSTKCVHKISNNRPSEQRCIATGCRVRVATGALACMNGHPQPIAGRVRGIGVADTTSTKEAY